MSVTTRPVQRESLVVRRFHPDLQAVPRHWFSGSALLTHAMNAQNLIFPEAERFFIRSVHAHFDQVIDPAQRATVRQFIGQEAQHGRSHEQALDLLRSQGFHIDGWLSRYRKSIHHFERIAPARLCLSVTAAAEHFTARIAECWLTEGRMDQVPPEMAAMLGWHAAEEIEHKAVAFDVLQIVDARWGLRVLGAVLAALFLLTLLVSATASLLWQDPDATGSRLVQERQAAGKENIRATRFIERHMAPYLARDFHPNDRDNLHIARRYLDQIAARFDVRPPISGGDEPPAGHKPAC
ncbi:MAG: metal-dependent hydrolase [Myxococcota bacterium]